MIKVKRNKKKCGVGLLLALLAFTAWPAAAIFDQFPSRAVALPLRDAIVDCRDHAGRSFFKGYLRYPPESLQRTASGGFILSGRGLKVSLQSMTTYSDCSRNRYSVSLEQKEHLLFCASGSIADERGMWPLGATDSCWRQK